MSYPFLEKNELAKEVELLRKECKEEFRLKKFFIKVPNRV